MGYLPSFKVKLIKVAGNSEQFEQRLEPELFERESEREQSHQQESRAPCLSTS